MSGKLSADQSDYTAIAAAILAGGSASRYGGQPKGLIQLPDGRTIIERLIGELRLAGLSNIVICVNDAQAYQHFGIPIVSDLRPGYGPLSGIEATLQHYQESAIRVLILPCDLPAITAEEIRYLAAKSKTSHSEMSVARVADGDFEPLIMVLRTAALTAVRRALDAGDYRVRSLCRTIETAFVDFPNARSFANINTPEDLADWLRNEAT